MAVCTSGSLACRPGSVISRIGWPSWVISTCSVCSTMNSDEPASNASTASSTDGGGNEAAHREPPRGGAGGLITGGGGGGSGGWPAAVSGSSGSTPCSRSSRMTAGVLVRISCMVSR